MIRAPQGRDHHVPTTTADVLDQDRIARIISLPRTEAPFVSLYLRGWGALSERRAVLKNLVREGETQVELDTGWDDARKREARGLLERVRAHADGLVGRMPTQGRGAFALFLGAKGELEQIELPMDLRDRIQVDRSPYASPLASLIDQYERYGVIVADQRNARLFEVYLGQIQGWEELSNEVTPLSTRVAEALPAGETPKPGKPETGKHRRPSGRHATKAGGFHGLDELRRRNHADYVKHQFLQQVADRAFRRFKVRPFDRLILAGPHELLPLLEDHLHSYLRQRVVAREDMPRDLPKDEARRRIIAIEDRVEAQKEKELLQDVHDQLGKSGLAVAGLDESLRALFYGQVRTLIVLDNDGQPGRECPECKFLFVRPQDELERTPTLVECPVCKRATRRVPDIMDEAVELAITSGARVEHIAHARDTLKNLGGVAAVLRFR
jgi:peptide chain release factor subunit 1